MYDSDVAFQRITIRVLRGILLMSVNNELIPKPISELLTESFFIPAYQRGFRWTQREVTDLLDDISEFQKQSEEGPKSAFYCLQPVVVKKHDNEWELVDGQQRLTTIFIILSYLKDIAALLGKKQYRIRYETRIGSGDYIETIDEARHTENIDFFYMYHAKQAIHEWFEARDGTYKIKFLQTLLNDDETGKNVKVIWYQINEDIEVTSVFTRLNMGKIPLTNAELVKALFLKGSNFKENDRYLLQIKIAQEWDDIERALQLDDFWCFISNQPAEANRIEFVLNLLASKLSFEDQTIPKRDRFYVFLVFARWLSECDEPIDQVWGRVKHCFMTLRGWYEDRSLFHLVGFLISSGTSVMDVMDIYENCATKHDFRKALSGMVFKKVFSGLSDINTYENRSSLEKAIEEHLAQLSYYSTRSHLVSVLLLFNVVTLLINMETNTRFQFDRFKKESWDIEHIRSVASEMPSSKSRQKVWLNGIVQYIENELEKGGIASSINADQLEKILTYAREILSENTFNSEAFESIFNQVYSLYMPDGNDETNHSVGNLTLLDSSTNRSYQNAIFPIKRNRIIALDKTATFIPVCTKNAFLKYYSERVESMMFWYSQDSESHQRAMVELLTTFFAQEDMAV